MRIQRRLQPPEPDAHAVFMPGPVGQIGSNRRPLRRGQYLPRHGARDVPVLHVHHDEHRDAFAVRQRKTRPVDAGLVLQPLFRLHGSSIPVSACHTRITNASSLAPSPCAAAARNN